MYSAAQYFPYDQTRKDYYLQLATALITSRPFLHSQQMQQPAIIIARSFQQVSKPNNKSFKITKIIL